MLKQLLTIGIATPIILSLSACTTSGSQLNSCDSIKRQMIYNNTSHNVEASYTTSQQKQQLQQLYTEKGCQ